MGFLHQGTLLKDLLWQREMSKMKAIATFMCQAERREIIFKKKKKKKAKHNEKDKDFEF